MFHRSYFKVFLGLIVTFSLLAVIGLFFMGSVRSAGSPFVFGGRPVMPYPAQGEDGTAIPPVYYGGWHLGSRSMLCGLGLLPLLGLPLLLLAMGGLFFRRRFAGHTPCGPMKNKFHPGRGHPWPWEEEELSEAEMKRMKHWHKRHGVRAPWNENWDEDSAPAPEKPTDEPR